jgi:acylglycerol lipase
MVTVGGECNKFQKRARAALLACLLLSINGPATLATVATDAVQPPANPCVSGSGTDVSVRTGGDIPCTSWIQPDRPPFAAVLCLHGFGMNMNSYERFGQTMADLGIYTYAIDVRGFGSWQAAKGYNGLDFDQAIQDVQKTLKAIRRAHPDLPLVLIGESMGGALALQTMASDQSLADGLVCSVPADDRFGEKATDLKVAVSMLKGVNHKFPIGVGLLKQVTRDPKLINALEKDPRDRSDFSPKELIEFQKFMNRTDDEAKNITKIPVLFLQGGGDRLVKPKGTKDVYTRVATKEKDLLLIGSSEHLILEAGQFDGHVVASLTSWMYKQVVMPKYPEGMFTAQNTGLPAATLHQAIGHFRVGQGLVELGDKDGARQHLLQAIAYGKGTPIAPMASEILDSVTKPVSTPTEVAQSDSLFVTHEQAMANDLPTVIFFGAKWIDASYALNSVIERAAAMYNSRVNFVRVDADDPQNKTIVDGYGVAAVPSIVFLDSKNKIIGSELGSLSDRTLDAELPKILDVGRTDVAINVPKEVAAAKPSIIMFGSNKIAQNGDTEVALNRLIEPYGGKVEFTELNADDPKNAELLKPYADKPLPIVLFLNSTHTIVSYTSGPVSEQDLVQAMSNITTEKQLPLKAASKP